MSRKQDSKYNAAEAAIVTFVEALGKLAANADMRTMVRDAGAISPLVALLVSGTGNVPGLAASVLRDLALHSGNRTAILESDGVAQLVRMLHNESKVIASEAADALRSLAANNGAVCKVVRDNGGIKMLVKLAQGGKAAEAATGAISNIAEADPTSRQEIGDEGGVAVLVSLLVDGLDNVGKEGGRARDTDWAYSHASEETSKALVQLSGHSSCVKRMLDASIVGPLVRLLLRAYGHSQTASSNAASLLVMLLTQHPSEAMVQTLDAFTLARKDESLVVASQGWSQAFPDLKTLLHAAAEKRLAAVEEGNSSAAIQQAIEIGRAVEIPDERLEAAKATFQEFQDKRRREKLAAAAEERRSRKEEERQRQLEREAAEAPAAEDVGKRSTRKAALNTGAVKPASHTAALIKKAEILSAQAAQSGTRSSEEQKLAAEAATVTAMEGMNPLVRERMLKKMVRDGVLVPGATGILAEYATALGLLPSASLIPAEAQSLTPSGRGALRGQMEYDGNGGYRPKGDLTGLMVSDDANEVQRRAANRAMEKAKAQAARNDLASKAMQRRLAMLGGPGKQVPAEGDDYNEEDDDDDDAWTDGSSYDVDEDEDEAAAARAAALVGLPLGSNGGAQQQPKKGFFGGFFGKKSDPPPNEGDAGAEGPRKRRRRRRRRPKDGETLGLSDGLPTSAISSTADGFNLPSYMMPMFSKMLVRPDEGQQLFMLGGKDPMKLDAWRKRWENKFTHNDRHIYGAPTGGTTTALGDRAMLDRNKLSDSQSIAGLTESQYAQLTRGAYSA